MRTARMPMRQARDIMERLTNAQVHPALAQIVVEQQERIKLQQQQIFMLAENFGTLQNLFEQVLGQLGIRDANLKRLGVEEMLKGSMSDMVKSVAPDDGEPDDTTSRPDRLPS